MSETKVNELTDRPDMGLYGDSDGFQHCIITAVNGISNYAGPDVYLQAGWEIVRGLGVQWDASPGSDVIFLLLRRRLPKKDSDQGGGS